MSLWLKCKTWMEMERYLSNDRERKRERISKDTNIQKTVLLALALDISTIPETKKQK